MLSDVLSDKTFKTYFFYKILINCVVLKKQILSIHILNYIYDNQHILIQRSVKFFTNFVKTYKGDLENDREYNTPIERCNLN